MYDYTIIGQPNCRYCDKAKKLLDAHGYTYDYVDIGKDTAVKTFLARVGFLTVPIILEHSSLTVWPFVAGGYDELEDCLGRPPMRA